MTTNDTTSITPIAVRIVGQRDPSYHLSTTRVSRTAAPVSQSRRSRIAVLRYLARSSSSATSRLAPARRSPTRSSAGAREYVVSAASAAKKTPASTTRAPAVTSPAGPPVGSLTSRPLLGSRLGAPGREQLLLEPEHLLVLLRLGVVIA